MYFRRILVTALLVMCATVVSAQDVRRGTSCRDTCQDCPEPDSLICSIAPATCDDCRENCGVECEPIRRVGKERTYHVDRNLGFPGYHLDRTVGVQQLAYDLNWETWSNPVPHPHARMTTGELMNDIHSHGIRAVKLWFKGDPFDGTGSWCWSPDYWNNEEHITEDNPEGHFSCSFGDYGFEDMSRVWAHWGVTTFTVRFVNECWSIQEHNSCALSDLSECKLSGKTFANEPTYWIAKTFLERFGWMHATVIFADWEQDWSIRGQNSRGYVDGSMRFPWLDSPKWYRKECVDEFDEQTCGEMIIEGRREYVKRVIRNRQRAIMKARAEFPRTNLRVLHAIIYNRYPGNFEDTDLGIYIIDLIMELDVIDRPDLIGLSFWSRSSKISDALEWARQITGYPRHRFYIDEFGEWREADQYERIFNEGRRAWCWGVDLLNVWTWQQTWCGKTRDESTKSHSLFEQLNCPKPEDDPQALVEFGDPRPGYYAIQDLLRWQPYSDECIEVMNLPPTASGKDAPAKLLPEKTFPPY